MSLRSEGNLIQLRFAVVLKDWEKYLSPTIQNQLNVEIGNSVLRCLLSDIRDAKFFGVISDETTDAAGEEQVRNAMIKFNQGGATRYIEKSYPAWKLSRCHPIGQSG